MLKPQAVRRLELDRLGVLSTTTIASTYPTPPLGEVDGDVDIAT